MERRFHQLGRDPGAIEVRGSHWRNTARFPITSAAVYPSGDDLTASGQKSSNQPAGRKTGANFIAIPAHILVAGHDSLCMPSLPRGTSL